MTRPILVTGSHRSGTTWAGRMLCASRAAGYVHEPFNPNRSPGWFPEPLPYWFMYLTEENAVPYERDVERLLAFRYPLRALARARSPRALARQLPEIARSIGYRAQRRRTLLKDPMALFSAEWLARRFGMDVVVMIRHPAAFVGSIKKLNWGFDYERNWLAQDLLMRDLLGRWAGHFEGYEGEVDLVGEGIVMWNAMYDVVRGYRERHPDWHFVRYDDLADDPMAGFRDLYERLGLPWDERAQDAVMESTSEANVKDVPAWRRRAIKRDSRAAKRTWGQRLTPEEVERVRRETAEVAAPFYSEKDWELRR
ncbi:MAG TPA: sulfotransferase [Actinomycetota bacterium]|nr:sulfotransferase [Actinomycetota bacterium]